MNPSADNPLHRNLTEIDWDIRKPVSHAVCFTGAGNIVKLRKHGVVTLPQYAHLPIVMFFDVGSSEADWATGAVLTNLMAYHNAKGHSWASAVAIPTENQPLTVKNVLDVLRNYWYEPLTPGELRYIYSMGLHEAVAHANAERAAIVGEHWSDRDDARLRRLDLLGYNIRFQGFAVVRVDNSIQLRYTLGRDLVGDL